MLFIHFQIAWCINIATLLINTKSINDFHVNFKPDRTRQITATEIKALFFFC